MDRLARGGVVGQGRKQAPELFLRRAGVAQLGRSQGCGIAQRQRGRVVPRRRVRAPGLCQRLQSLDPGLAQHARARRHQRVQGRARARTVARGGLVQRQPRAHVGHALGAQRVAAQVGEGAVIVQARGLLQLVEQGREAGAVETGCGHDAVADPVGLALHVAREVQLVLQRQRLSAHDGGVADVGILCLAGRDGAQHHGRQHPGRLPALLRQQARDMALRDMAELVREHRGQLVGAGHGRQQAHVHAEVATRQREGVDRRLAQQQQAPGVALVGIGRQFAARLGRIEQRPPDLLQIIGQQRVVQVVGVAVDRACDLVADAALLAQRHLAAVAQAGQGAHGWQGRQIGRRLGLRPGLGRQQQQGGCQPGPPAGTEGSAHRRIMPVPAPDHIS